MMKTKQTASSPHSALTHNRLNPLRAVWLACAAVSLIAFDVSAVVTFDDGGEHVINDATYQFQSISVKNGTTLRIEEGAVFEGFMDASRGSSIIINGGTFGGAANGSGQVWADYNGNVIVNNGYFGGSGYGSGSVLATSVGAKVTILGGNFGGDGDYSGVVGTAGTTGYDQEAEIAGGNFAQGSGNYAGCILFFPGSRITFRAVAYDTSGLSVNASGLSYGLLGVTFCGYESQTLKLDSTWTHHDGAVVNLLVENCDADGDGVPDDVDACPYSDMRNTVWIGDMDTGVSNDINGALIDENGCTLADLINEQLTQALDDARNYGQLVSRMSHYFDLLKKAGTITGREEGALMRCL